MNLMAIQCMFRLSFRMLWPDSHEIPKLFTASSVSENRFLHFIHNLSCSAHLRMSTEFHSFYRGHTIFGLDWNICMLPLSALQKFVSTFWTFLYIFSLLENKINADMLFFQECHFQDTPKSQMDNTYLHWTRYYSTITHATALFYAGNDSADSSDLQ